LGGGWKLSIQGEYSFGGDTGVKKRGCWDDKCWGREKSSRGGGDRRGAEGSKLYFKQWNLSEEKLLLRGKREKDGEEKTA